MIEGGKISSRQLLWLLITTILSTAILFLPSIVVAEAKQDGWLSAIFATFVGLLVVLVVSTLGLRFPQQTIVEYSEIILGRFLGKIVGLVFIWFFLHMSAIVVREFAEFMVVSFMPKTPLMVFILTFVLLSAFVLRGGIEVIARTNEVFFPVVFFLIIIVTILVVKDADFTRLMPVLERGISPVLKGTLIPSGWQGEIVVLAFLLPYLNRIHEGRRAGSLALLVVGFFLVLAEVLTVAVFGAEVAARTLFPTFDMVRYISIAEFLEHLDPFFMIFWIGSVFIKITLFYYITCLAIAQWLNLRDYKPITLPVGTIISALSVLLFDNITELVNFIAKVWGPYALSIQLGIPALLLVVAMLRRQGKR